MPKIIRNFGLVFIEVFFAGYGTSEREGKQKQSGNAKEVEWSRCEVEKREEVPLLWHSIVALAASLGLLLAPIAPHRHSRGALLTRSLPLLSSSFRPLLFSKPLKSCSATSATSYSGLRLEGTFAITEGEGSAKRLKMSDNNDSEDLKFVIGRSIAEVFLTFKQQLDRIKALMLERASATRAASRINKEDLRSLRSTLGILGPIPDVDGFSPDACVVDVEALLGAESDASETFWDERYEPQREADYIAELMNCIPPGRRFIWKCATKKTLKRTFKDGDFPVSASNDVVLCPKRYSSVFELGAILRVEIKKKLTWQGLHAAEVEFYLWAEESMFPYVQLITDMQRGGVPFYCKSGRDVRMLAFGSMESVRVFLRRVGNSLPPDLGQDDPSGRVVLPDSLSEPSRKKFTSKDLGVNSAGQKQAGQPASPKVALWNMAALWKNNLHDVGNIRDFDGFDLGDDMSVHG